MFLIRHNLYIIYIFNLNNLYYKTIIFMYNNLNFICFNELISLTIIYSKVNTVILYMEISLYRFYYVIYLLNIKQNIIKTNLSSKYLYIFFLI